MQTAALWRDGAEIEERRGLLCVAFKDVWGLRTRFTSMVLEKQRFEAGDI